MRAVVLSIALTAAACSGPGDTYLDVVFDPCESVVLTPSVDASPEERDALSAAIGWWNMVMSTRLAVAPAEGVALPVRFERSAPLFHGVYLDEEGAILINRRLSGEPLEITVAHELGHAFGLWHVEHEVRTSVMNPGNLTVAPNAGDASDVAVLWGRCQDSTAAVVDAQHRP
ncbi:MAG TPA: hypothetical protein VML75_19505 [Kofleriaceae bacterium]|nr:hypothetical protein [Kofleriaceae bacterium]